MGFLRCIVLDTATGAGHDIEIEFEPAAATSTLIDALPLDVRGRPVFAGPHRLDPAAPLGESPLVAGCVLSVGAPTPDIGEIPPEAAGVLRVISGPDAGSWTWIAAGAGAVVGRGDTADLELSDPKASRPHAVVSVTPGSRATGGDPVAAVRDLDSANGTRVAGVTLPSGADAAELPEHGCFEVGDTLLQWIPLDRVRSGWRRAPDGRVEFTRRFHSAPTPGAATVNLPPSPHDAGGRAIMMVTSIGAPLAIGVVMWMVTQSIAFLAMTLITPVTFGAQQWYERRRKRRDDAEFGAERDRAGGEISAAVAAQEQLRRLNDPDELSLTLSALGALPRLWTKRKAGPDALTVRVGTRDEPAAIQLQGDRWKGFEPPTLRAVPVTVDLRRTGVLGVVGDRAMVEGLARWVLVQLATRRSPEDLRLVVLSRDDGAHLRWTRWLPHLDSGADGDAPARVGVAPRSVRDRVRELRLLLEARLQAAEEDRGNASFDSDVVVVLDGAHELRDLTGMRAILTRGPEVGVYAICLADSDINECRGRVAVDADGRLEVIRDFSSGAERAWAETTGPDDAERVSRLLTPLRDRAQAAGADSAIPYPVRYLDLVGIHTPQPDDVLALWKDHAGPTTEVPLGADGQGVVNVDLAVQGPHTMLGGATGAGKSILLQTLVVSLLLHNRPDELNLLLVDFKGGAAFQPFANCPQVVGLITSTGATPEDTFDDAAAQRVLASIRAEVQRRERLLAAYGGEIKEYLTRRPHGAPPLPRLVMIFDEFARVLDTAPDFVRELVNVAGKGRSLGMHLLLATQSLQGKLTPEMKNNIELRISLRQNQPEESTEVLDVPDAAAIPGRLRGRGLILCTKEDPPLPRPFQAGYLGAPPPTTAAPPATVRIVDWPAVGDSRPDDVRPPTGERTDQDLLIAAIEAAAARTGLPAPFRPLLPALPLSLPLESLPALVTAPVPAGELAFGVVDEPARQAQPAITLPLAGDDRLMIAGGAQSGRTTAIRALVHAAALSASPDDLHLYVVQQQPSGLADYAGLPHCGGVFGPDDPDRLRRFVTWLAAETDRRVAARFDAAEPPPGLLVLIDGWELFHDPADGNSIPTTMVDRLRAVISSGPKVGVRVVVACGRGPLMSKPGDLFNVRLVLPFPQADVVRSAMPSGTQPPLAVPGRAGDAATGRHVQIARPATSPAELIASAPAASRRPPLRFDPLPRRVALGEVTAPPEAGGAWVPLGLSAAPGSAAVTACGIDLFAGPPGLLVSGPSGSGRSTAALALARGLSSRGVGVVVLCPPRSPLVEHLGGAPGVALLVGPKLSDEVVRQAATGLAREKIVVVVDDCEQIDVTPTTQSFDELPTLLAEAVSPETLGRMGLVLCGNGFALLDGRRPLSNLTRRVLEDGARLLLTPTVPGVAREHRIALEIDQFTAGPPGRGYLVVDRDQALVQLGA